MCACGGVEKDNKQKELGNRGGEKIKKRLNGKERRI